MISRRFISELAKSRLKYVLHSARYKERTPDEVWLEDCARRKWLALNADGRIRKRSKEKAAVLVNKGRLLILKTEGASEAQWVEALVSRWKKIRDAMHQGTPIILKLGAKSGHLSSLPINERSIYRPLQILDKGYEEETGST